MESGNTPPAPDAAPLKKARKPSLTKGQERPDPVEDRDGPRGSYWKRRNGLVTLVEAATTAAPSTRFFYDKRRKDSDELSASVDTVQDGYSTEWWFVAFEDNEDESEPSRPSFNVTARGKVPGRRGLVTIEYAGMREADGLEGLVRLMKRQLAEAMAYGGPGGQR